MKNNIGQKMLLEQIKEQIKNQGYRITGPRLAIIAYLINAEDHPDINDLFEEVKNDYPGIGIATVYRTVELLRRLNILSIIDFSDDRQRYEINLSHNHHHHLVCMSCKRIVEFGNCNFKQLVDDIELATRFKIDSHTTIAYGRCPHCAQT